VALSPDERAELRTTAQSLLQRESSAERVRVAIAGDAGFDRALWSQMIELGWTSIHVPEELGGAGCGYGDLAVVLHELGRAITPSPFLASAVLASSAFVLAGNHDLARELLTPIVDGEVIGTVALANTDGSCDRSRATAVWSSANGKVRLDGAASFVLDADMAGTLVVAARDADGAVAFVAIDPAAAGVHLERTPLIDETRRAFTVSFDGVEVDEGRLLTEPGAAGDELFERLLAIGSIAAGCDAAGAAEHALDQATAYAKDRQQFGKPIGSFQAVKHLCANMAVAVESSRVATVAAADALDGDPDGWPRAASVTASYVGPACAEACAIGLRVHGGIGFTWEHDSHLYLKRVKLDEVLFGTPSWHRRRLADTVFPTLVAS
jgi:alkylation response protein AidB-like acyl-CoA dehydrogenase